MRHMAYAYGSYVPKTAPRHCKPDEDGKEFLFKILGYAYLRRVLLPFAVL